MKKKPQVLLCHCLKQLRLPAMPREYRKVAEQCARQDVDCQRVRFTTAAALIHDLIEARDEKRLLRHQITEWTEVLGSERLTGALLGRLTHRVHTLEMNGESYRLKARKGVFFHPESGLVFLRPGA